jgi:hypothetical protein
VTLFIEIIIDNNWFVIKESAEFFLSNKVFSSFPKTDLSSTDQFVLGKTIFIVPFAPPQNITLPCVFKVKTPPGMAKTPPTQTRAYSPLFDPCWRRPDVI